MKAESAYRDFDILTSVTDINAVPVLPYQRELMQKMMAIPTGYSTKIVYGRGRTSMVAVDVTNGSMLHWNGKEWK